MENNRYAVEQVISEEQTEAREYIEREMHGKMLRNLEKILFSGQMVAVKIERDTSLYWPEGVKVRYTAEIRAVRQIEYTYSAIQEQAPRPYTQKESIIKRAARKLRKVLKGGGVKE